MTENIPDLRSPAADAFPCREETHLNYLKIANLAVGLILNFKHARLEWERVVLTAADKLNRR